MAMTNWRCLCTCLVLSSAVRTNEDLSENTSLAARRNNEGAVIIDFGTYEIKAGKLEEYDGSNKPSVTLRSTHQVSKYKNIQQSFDERDGHEEHSMWQTTYVMKDGLPVKWEHFENLLKEVFKLLGVEAAGSSVILLYSASKVDNAVTEKIASLLFETLEVSKLAIYDQAITAMFSSGEEKTALVVNIGEDVTYAMAIFEGFAIPHSKTFSKLGSRYVTDCINKKRFDSKVTYLTQARGVKEAKAYVAETSYDEEVDEFQSRDPPTYALSDGTIQTLGDEIFSCPEHLLNPGKFNVQDLSIIDAAVAAIKSTDSDIHADLLRKVVVTGGGAKINKLTDRLLKGMEDSFSNLGIQVKDQGSQSFSAEQRQNMAWDGAALFGYMREHLNWMTKDAYEDIENGGPKLVHQMVA